MVDKEIKNNVKLYKLYRKFTQILFHFWHKIEVFGRLPNPCFRQIQREVYFRQRGNGGTMSRAKYPSKNLKLPNKVIKDHLVPSKLLDESECMRKNSVESVKNTDKTNRSSTMRKVLLKQTIPFDSGSSSFQVTLSKLLS